tara:strand:- start:411 stop:1490 length:1080 start_codon:yes stop_codon:yes gene_type:complete
MFNDLAKDYTAPKGGTQSSQFENKELSDNPKLQPGKTVTYSGTRYKVMGNDGYVLTLQSVESGNELKLNLGQLKDRPIKEKTMKKINEKTFGGKGAVDDMKKSPEFNTLQGPDKEEMIKKLQQGGTVSLEEDPSEGNAFGAAMQKAKEAGEDSFELGGKTFSVKEVEMEMNAEPEMTNDVGKDNWQDDEGRHAKMKLHKTAEYSVKLSQMLKDMDQLPAWVQEKIVKASDYMSTVYHYLDYEASRSQDNLMEHMDKHRKRVRLMEGATEKLFKLFNAGKTDSEVRAHYLQMQVDMPESFVAKLRKNWEDLRKTKLDLTLADKEAEGFEKIQPEPSIDGMEGGEIDGMEEDKQLSTRLFK